MESVWRRVASIFAGLFAVLGCSHCGFSLPFLDLRCGSFPKLTHLPSAPNQTPCFGSLLAAHVWMTSSAVLGFTEYLPWAGERLYFQMYFFLFSIFPLLLHFDPMVYTPLIPGWRSSLWTTSFPALCLHKLRPSQNSSFFALWADYLKTLINANTVVRRASLWSFLPTFWYIALAAT